MCLTCESKVSKKYDDYLECCVCSGCVHIKCEKLKLEDFQQMKSNLSISTWKCKVCCSITSDDKAATIENEPYERPDLAPKGLLGETGDGGGASRMLVENDGGGTSSCLCGCSDMLGRMLAVIERQADLIKALENKVSDRFDRVETLIGENDKAIHGLRQDFKTTVGKITSSVANNIKPVDNCLMTGTDNRSTDKNYIDVNDVIKNGRNPPKGCTVSTDSGERCNNEGAAAPKVVTKDDLSVAVLRAQSSSVMDKCIKLSGDTPPNSAQASATVNGSEWQNVARKRRKRPVMVGSSTQELPIRGVPKCVELHAYRINPSTSADDLYRLLKPHFPEVLCDALTSRRPELYSSFKITIYDSNFRAAMNPDIWPLGACVGRFFHPRRKKPMGSS